MEGEEQQVTIELKVGPIKRANRIGVKIEEYEEEKDAADFPFSKFVTDVLRASYICETAGDMVRVYEGLLHSEDFEVVRLKNKIGQCKGPVVWSCADTSARAAADILRR